MRNEARGYNLFYDHFRKVAEFTWTYHSGLQPELPLDAKSVTGSH